MKTFGVMLRKCFDGEFDFPLREDKNHKVIDRCGVFNPDGRGWPHPSVYLIFASSRADPRREIFPQEAHASKTIEEFDKGARRYMKKKKHARH